MAYTTIDFQTKKALKQAVASANVEIGSVVDIRTLADPRLELKVLSKTPQTITGKVVAVTGGVGLHATMTFSVGDIVPFHVRCYQPGLGPDLSTFTGTITLEGPHAPQPHKWYAQATLVNGVVVSVR